jgi:nicotinamide riboside kinase
LITVGISGAHGVGKTYIVGRVTELLNAQGLTVATIPSVNRQLAELGVSGRTWYDQHLGSAVRTYAQLLYRKDAADKGYNVLLSDRTLLDVATYNRLYFNDVRNRSEASTAVEGLTLVNLAADLEAYWDLAYVKEPHPNYPLEADGVRENYADLDQKTFTTTMQEVLEEVCVFGINSTEAVERVRTLPLDRDEAATQVFNDIQGMILND